MSNDFQYLVRQNYSEATEKALQKSLTALDLAEMVTLTDGTTKNIPNVNMKSTSNYTKYTDQTITDVKTGNDTIVLDTTPMVNFAMDELDEDDNYINVKPEVIQNASYQIKKRIDGDFFYKGLSAKWKYDANGFGLNSGTLSPITLAAGASQNISTTFGKAKAGLTNIGVNGDNLALAIPWTTVVDLATLGLQTYGDVASQSYTRGFRGNFGGLKVYEVSTLTSTTTLDLATNPSANDYVDIQGTRFTFVASPTAAGDVDIGGDADTSAQNLVAAINGGAGAGTAYIEIGADDRARLEGVTATDGTNLITIVSKNGELYAKSSMTNASNDFQAQVTNAVIMEKGAIKMVYRGVNTKMRDESKKLVTNYFIYARYGLTVTTRGAEKMCVIPLVSLAAEA